MSITDELREWMKGSTLSSWAAEHLTAIADRIDSELAERYAALPLDVDGVPIRVGHEMVGPYLKPSHVDGVGVGVFFVYDGEAIYNGYDARCYRHHHAPTVEDVLREFAYGLGVTVADSYVAASAAKLRLAEGEDE